MRQINELKNEKTALQAEIEQMKFPDEKSKSAYMMYKNIVESAKGQDERLRAITAAGLIVSASLGMKEVNYNKPKN